MEAIETASSKSTHNNMRNGPRQGGFRAAMFVFALSTLENVGFMANLSSMVLYFFQVMHFDLSGSANTFTNSIGATFLLSILGGFISDTYLNRLNTTLIFGVLEILGYTLLTIQAHYQSLRPDLSCISCHLEGSNAGVFYLSLSLLALGLGGVRGASPSLGADQFDKDHPKEKKQLATFFNWLLLSVTLGGCFGVTVVVWIRTRRDWSLGFLISMLLALLGLIAVAAGKPFYRVRTPGDSPLVRVLQVFVVAVRNRNMPAPESQEELYEINDKGDQGFNQERISHTDQFRLLDKAAVLPQGVTPEVWKVCSVTQVEEIKILIRMLPVLGSTIIMNTCLAQLQTFSVQQANIMDVHLGSFEVPPASVPIIPFVFMTVLLPIYEFTFVPLARRFTGHHAGITHLQRVGVGLVLSIISMTIAGFIEIKRKNAFNIDNHKINLFWLSFQYGIFGIADMFTLVGLMEFFYSEAPAGMRSLSTSFTFLSLSFGYFLSSVFVNIVEETTKRVTPSRQGWLEGVDLNHNHLELFFWFLAVLSCINFVLYIFCAKWYQYRRMGSTQEEENEEATEKKRVGEGGNGLSKEFNEKGSHEESFGNTKAGEEEANQHSIESNGKGNHGEASEKRMVGEKKADGHSKESNGHVNL